MVRSLLPLACIAAIAFGSSEVRAEPLAPIYVTVVGQGAVRVRLTGGVVAPCDSADDAPVYEGWLEPGRYRFYSPSRSVCMQHTWGESRDGEWSTPAILPTVVRLRRWSGTLVPFEIRISTERPYS